VKETAGFYVAGQGIPTVANGAAVAADWMSAASFISMAGLIAFLGYDGAIYLMGWTGGYVLLALLLAPYLRKWGKFTVPEFVGDRYSELVRTIAAGAAILVSFTYVVGQMRGGGIVFSRVTLGQTVGKGDLLGTVTNPITNVRTRIVSSYDGRIIGMALNQVVQPGFATHHIGIAAPRGQVSPPEAVPAEEGSATTEPDAGSDDDDNGPRASAVPAPSPTAPVESEGRHSEAMGQTEEEDEDLEED
jgi:hypothetical protein